MADADKIPQATLVLASASPRRKLLLHQIGLRFEVIPVDVDEQAIFDHIQCAGARDGATNPSADGLTAAQVLAAAEAKAAGAAALLPADGQRLLIVAADTVVFIDNSVLGKPIDQADAVRMLTLLAGRTHRVLTGVVVLDPTTGRSVSGVEDSRVTFTPLTKAWIEAYVATGEPMDKAGAYAVQGLGSIFIERVEGCYFNVVGLPLSLLARLLREQGFEVIATW
jgi:septum formation protein